MLTKILIIVGGSVATVIGMYFLGKAADGKDDKTDNPSEKQD